ncbi:MAG: hypothetical protein AVO34_04255 [Firmicutes bacterium ML8_F2]|nr:MAG: hypothetical protein AVO34_04255 [Firmicutes bacterium ML8_F2]
MLLAQTAAAAILKILRSSRLWQSLMRICGMQEALSFFFNRGLPGTGADAYDLFYARLYLMPEKVIFKEQSNRMLSGG